MTDRTPPEPISPPRSPEELHEFVRDQLAIELPPDHGDEDGKPMAYLTHAYFEGKFAPEDLARADPIVCANRGGGKTFLGAVATTLDLLFKPGIHIRILAGSLEQGKRMHAHLRFLFARPLLRAHLAEPVGARDVRLRSGAHAAVLAQSQTSVRGTRVQKVRCDEVELFDRDIWDAAQLTTRSAPIPGPWGDHVRGAVEALSTMHRPFGLMSDLVEHAATHAHERRLFRWGVADVLARCEPTRHCDGCDLRDECAGRAKHGRGHIEILDALSLKTRVDHATWNAEMRCRTPSRSACVYPEFDPPRHTFSGDHPDTHRWIAGMDFGFRDPTVVLFACVDDAGVLWIVDEHLAREVTLDRHIDEIRDRPWPTPEWIAVDPAGRQRNDQTGLSAVSAMERAGLRVRSRRVPVWDGLCSVRARLTSPTGGPARLRIHTRCTHLIESLVRYHFDTERRRSLDPVKDGPDHAADALRYLIVNLDHGYQAASGQYL